MHFCRMFVAFSDVYEMTLTIVFVCTIIAISITMLLFQIEIVEYLYTTVHSSHFIFKKISSRLQTHNESDSILLLAAAIFCAATLMLLLFICELGQVLGSVCY